MDQESEIISRKGREGRKAEWKLQWIVSARRTHLAGKFVFPSNWLSFAAFASFA